MLWYEIGCKQKVLAAALSNATSEGEQGNYRIQRYNIIYGWMPVVFVKVYSCNSFDDVLSSLSYLKLEKTRFSCENNTAI